MLNRRYFSLMMIGALLFLFVYTLPCQAATVTLPTDLLKNNSLFYKQWGPGSEITRTLSGSEVQFTVSGLTGSGTGWGDNFELSPLAGGTGLHNANFGAYDRFEMRFTNLSSYTINVHLFMNTGFTSNGSQLAYNTFFAGPWLNVSAGQTILTYLNFSSAETYGATDDPETSYRYNDGTWNPVFRLDQVTNIGFELADFDTDASGTIGLKVMPTPVPPPIGLLSLGLISIVAIHRKTKTERR